MRIRSAVLDDVRDIVEVHKGDVNAWYKGAGEQRREAPYEHLTVLERHMHGGPWMSVETCSIHIDSMLRRGHYPVVAESHGRVVGEIEVFIGEEYPLFGKYLTISVLYVHPEYQRQGVGSALMGYVLDLAEEHGCDCASVNTDNDSYYRRFGFEQYFQQKQLRIETGRSEFGYKVSDLLSVDYSLIRGMAMPVGRYVCSRLEWERDEMAQYHIPELLEGAHRRLSVETPSASAYLVLKQNPAWAQHLTALSWSDTMTLRDILEVIRAEGARMGFGRLDLLLHADDFDRVKGKIHPFDVSTSGHFVKWLR